MGKPFSDIIGIYFNQISEYPMLSMNAPTFWQMIDFVNPNDFFKYVGIGLAMIFVLVFVILYIIKKGCPDNKTILSLALIFAIGIPFFLPHMHDRYFFMADILSLVYVFVFGFRKIFIPLLVQFASLICYFNYLGLTNLCCGNILPLFMTGSVSGTLMFAGLVQMVVCHVNNGGKLAEKLKIIATFGGVIVIYITIQLLLPQNITVKTNDKKVCYIGINPYIYEDTVMVPIKGFLNASGYFVTMDTQTGHILAKKGGEQIEFDFEADVAIKPDGTTIKFAYPRSNINSNNCMSSYDLSLITDMQQELKDNVLYFSK